MSASGGLSGDTGERRIVDRSDPASRRDVPEQRGVRQRTGPAARPGASPPDDDRDSMSGSSRRRRSAVVTLVSVAAVVVVLALVAVVVIVGRNDERSASGVDRCVVGTWSVLSSRMEITTTEYGVIRFSSVGAVGKIRLGANGEGYTDYGDDAEFTAEVSGPDGTGKLKLKVTGVTRYDFATKDSTIVYSNVRDESKTTLTVAATEAVSSTQVDLATDSTTYSCQDETLTTFTDTQRSEARRSAS